MARKAVMALCLVVLSATWLLGTAPSSGKIRVLGAAETASVVGGGNCQCLARFECSQGFKNYTLNKCECCNVAENRTVCCGDQEHVISCYYYPFSQYGTQGICKGAPRLVGDLINPGSCDTCESNNYVASGTCTSTMNAYGNDCPV